MEEEEDDDDRISSLPDEILCHILSFVETKEACATRVLSKRWKSVWQWSTSLTADFDDACYTNSEESYRLFLDYLYMAFTAIYPSYMSLNGCAGIAPSLPQASTSCHKPVASKDISFDQYFEASKFNDERLSEDPQANIQANLQQRADISKNRGRPASPKAKGKKRQSAGSIGQGQDQAVKLKPKGRKSVQIQPPVKHKKLQSAAETCVSPLLSAVHAADFPNETRLTRSRVKKYFTELKNKVPHCPGADVEDVEAGFENIIDDLDHHVETGDGGQHKEPQAEIEEPQVETGPPHSRGSKDDAQFEDLPVETGDGGQHKEPQVETEDLHVKTGDGGLDKGFKQLSVNKNCRETLMEVAIMLLKILTSVFAEGYKTTCDEVTTATMFCASLELIGKAVLKATQLKPADQIYPAPEYTLGKGGKEKITAYLSEIKHKRKVAFARELKNLKFVPTEHDGVLRAVEEGCTHEKNSRDLKGNGWAYFTQLPWEIRSHVRGMHDVVGDGNCGYRCVAKFLGVKEDFWRDVRTSV